MLSKAEIIAQVAEHFAAHDAHGYSQPNRGKGEAETITLSDGRTGVISSKDVDCSEMVRQCVNVAFSGKYTTPIDWMWTGNEDELLRAQGFQRLAFDRATTKRGDVLWTSGHTGVALGGGMQADARGDENRGITGPKSGDQTGHEVERRALQTWWTRTYRYVEPPKPRPLPKQPDSKRTNDFGLAYRAHVERAGWLAPVHDGQVAGTVGQSARLEALKFTPPKGVRLTVNAHMQGIGWKSYEGIERGKYDPVVGTTGQSRRLEAVQIHAEGLPEGRRIRYRAHVQGIGWQTWVESGKTAGTTGQSRRLEALQVEIV